MLLANRSADSRGSTIVLAAFACAFAT